MKLIAKRPIIREINGKLYEVYANNKIRKIEIDEKTGKRKFDTKFYLVSKSFGSRSNISDKPFYLSKSIFKSS